MNFVKIKTAIALGMPNLFRVVTYKLGIELGFNKVKKITGDLADGELFKPYKGLVNNLECNKQWLDNHAYLGVTVKNKAIPSWHQSCLTQRSAPSHKPWYLIADFNEQLGDIKGVWEASRFDWVIGFVQKTKCGDELALDSLNIWLADWILNNPPYFGVNWKCGQEASIRVMHLALAAILLEQTNKTSIPLLRFVKAHLKRISPTIMYAVAQDNNHGTSEAAALYIGGSWLSLNGDSDGAKWQQLGIKWLENRARRLIETDGSFSQYSVNYHRLMLDTYSLVEVWRLKHKLPIFSASLYTKLTAATHWLYYFTNSECGDAPNLGANDGARLIPLTSSDYRDFRPSVQLASLLFCQALAYKGSGGFNLPLQWLELSRPDAFLIDKKSKDFDCGGYAFLKNSKAEVFLNYPKFKFRPSQCDALHIDLWLGNENVFRDGGTFSYNAGQEYIDYYGGVKSHNTVEFDEHDQMPRLSRFLLGGWLTTHFKKPLVINQHSQSVTVGYKDCYHCEHIRTVELYSSSLIVKDELSRFKNKAILRFRLIPSNWKVFNNSLVSDICTINFTADVHIKRFELTSGFESRYYYQESDIPVVEIEIDKPGIIITEVKL